MHKKATIIITNLDYFFMINSSVIQLECKFERIREVVGFYTERCGIAPNTSDDLSFIRLIKQQEVIDPIHTWRKSK